VLRPEAAIDMIAVGLEILRLRRAQNVPKAVQQMRRAAARSPSVNGRMTALISFSSYSGIDSPRGANGLKTGLFCHGLMRK